MGEAMPGSYDDPFRQDWMGDFKEVGWGGAGWLLIRFVWIDWGAVLASGYDGFQFDSRTLCHEAGGRIGTSLANENEFAMRVSDNPTGFSGGYYERGLAPDNYLTGFTDEACLVDLSAARQLLTGAADLGFTCGGYWQQWGAQPPDPENPEGFIPGSSNVTVQYRVYTRRAISWSDGNPASRSLQFTEAPLVAYTFAQQPCSLQTPWGTPESTNFDQTPGQDLVTFRADIRTGELLFSSVPATPDP
ncbi:hypothetical protein AA309_20255 [Microvirga vignae]|uniref:Uncharacterized protein n=1 Tax=Microvirga vignae TaxID=1225564 RepID=A0A0H1R8Q5_9HYPH|nr:hypothetical protein [Microvirga vignae]KLK91429.1 hypothetical protein AA309_20255 [Microvirga vignae]